MKVLTKSKFSRFQLRSDDSEVQFLVRYRVAPLAFGGCNVRVVLAFKSHLDGTDLD